MTLQPKIGSRLRFIMSTTTRFYTSGKEYVVRGEPSASDPMFRVDDNDRAGETANHHWPVDDILKYFVLIDEPALPVRTVTRLEIVPGTYGRLNVTGTYKGDRVTMQWVSEGVHDAVSIVGLNAAELRAAADIFNRLAEALEWKP